MLLIAHNRDILPFVLGHGGEIVLRIHKGYQNLSYEARPRKADFLGFRIGRNHGGRVPYGDQLEHGSQFRAQIQNLKF